MASDNSIEAPVYRYFTVDLMSNEILMEIPFQGVTWERALKAGGEFSGTIPVIEKTKHLNLYNTTMPGQTALYVVRNGVCVWGGIIWSRSYNVKEKELEISGSEFTSYFHHRLIWKTVNYQYSSTVTVTPDGMYVKFDDGSSSALTVGSSVQIEFHDPEDFRYSGYFKVAASPAPTLDSFTVKAGVSTAHIVSVEVKDGIGTARTDGPHGFNTGDTITFSGLGELFDGYSTAITAVGGSGSSAFSYPFSDKDSGPKVVDGTATRPVPVGVYYLATVTVRSDTYDYMRGLVKSVFDDFMGIDFANDYLNPGLQSELNITSKRLSQGFATVTTDTKHSLAVGQAVEVNEVGRPFDGEYEVTDTPDDYTFRYRQGGTLDTTTVKPVQATIVSRSIGNYLATVTTASPHGFLAGQRVTVDVGEDFDGIASNFNGFWEIKAVLSPTSFSYEVLTPIVAPTRTIPKGILTLPSGDVKIVSRRAGTKSGYTGSVVWVKPEKSVSVSVGQTAKISGLNLSTPIAQKSLDAANRIATITTSEPHGLLAGQSIKIAGLRDYSVPNTVNFQGSQGTITTRTNILRSPLGYSAGIQFGQTPTSGTQARTATGTDQGTRFTPGIAANPLDTRLEIDTIRALGTGFSFDTQAVMRGYTYTFSATVRSSKGVALTAFLRNAAGTSYYPINTSGVSVSDSQASTLGWVRQSITFTVGFEAPTLVYFVPALTNSTNITSTDWYSFRNAQLELSSVATPFFAGNSSTSGLSSYRWATGTANQSPSLEQQLGVPSARVTVSTTPAHNFAVGDSVELTAFEDSYSVSARSVSSNVATITTSNTHNIRLGDPAKIENITDNYKVSYRDISEKTATITLTSTHGVNVNDQVTISGMGESGRVIAKEIVDGIVILTFDAPHNFQVSQQIVAQSLGAPYDSMPDIDTIVLSTTTTRVLYQLQDKNGKDLPGVNAAPTKANGQVVSDDSILNGTFVVTNVPATNQVQFAIEANNSLRRFTTGPSLSSPSPVNGVYTVTAVPSYTTIQFALQSRNLPTTAVTPPDNVAVGDPGSPMITVPSILNGTRKITKVSRSAFTFIQDVVSPVASKKVFAGSISANSIFNSAPGNYFWTITAVPSRTTFQFTLSALNNVLETSNTLSAYVYDEITFNTTGSQVVELTNSGEIGIFVGNEITSVIPSKPVKGQGVSILQPRATVSTYGSYPGNTDIDVGFSTRAYSGVNVPPVAYRGFALTNVGTALDSYSGSKDGFEYRIDCTYDKDNDRFTRTFVLIPIDFPNPPPKGEASPPSRFGADKLVFEYPGSVIDVKMEESAENSATRFFVVGDADLGEDAANPFAAAAATDLLNAENDRKWPILDDSEKVSDVSDETVLYAYASQYLKENRPPDSEFTVTVDGSLQPLVASYAPGDWCSVIVDDDFLRERLASRMEPRDTVLVRKIDSFKVKVPDGITFPETVDLTLVAEWDVDKIDNAT